MNKIFKNKKIIFVAITLSLLGYLVFSDFASAQQFAPPQQLNLPGITPPGAGGVGLGATAKGIGAAAGLSILKTGAWAVSILGFLVLLQHALWWFIGFGYSLLNSAVNVALDPNWFQIDAVLQGWQLVRDFVNVWFILVFLIIAIGTILRTSSYQAKKLLPTLIIIALVVNFSMPVSKFVIDISNIISFQFLKAICPEVKNETGAQYCDFAGNLENGLDAKGFTQAIKESVEAAPPAEETTPKENPKVPFNNNELIPKAHAIAFGPILVIAARWIGPAVAFLAFENIASYFTNTSFGGVSVGAFVSALTTNIFLLFTAFVILAIALLFLIRIISLVFLVVVSPFGFAAMILPATQKYAEDWWSYLFKQSFFAPFVLFFLWMSLNLINNMKSAFTINGVPYDFTNPANARLMFYIFSILLLYASLWIAKKMGAIGAEAIIKWGNTARSAITGFVGGIAARNLWAPLGAAGIAKGIPETLAKIPLVGPLAGITAAEALRKIAKAGKAPEKAAEKAELGMRLAPADRGAYFAKLDRAAKEAMLRKMKGEERNSFISDLGTKDMASAQEARAILRTGAFAPEERAKTELDEFKYSYDLPEQWKKFGSLSADLQKQFLLGVEDADKRAQFLEQVRIRAVENDDFKSMAAFQNANTFLETNSAFSANQQYANKLARYKVEHTEAQKANRLAEFFDGIKDEKEQKSRFRFAMNDSQRLELVEAWKGDEHTADLKHLQDWVNLMDPADQDKFYRDSIGRRASIEGMVSFVRAVDTGDAPRDFAIRKMVLSGASPKQLGGVARAIPDLVPMTDDLARTMPKRSKEDYNTAKNEEPPPPLVGPAPIRGPSPRTPLPSALSNAITNKDFDNIVDRINEISEENLIKEAISRIKKINDTELTAKIERRINPIFKVKFMDNILPDKSDVAKMNKYVEAIKQTIRAASPADLTFSITEEVEINPEFQKAFVGSVTPEQLFMLRNRPNLINTLKREVSGNELLKTQTAEYIKQTTGLQDEENIKMMITRDPQTHAEAIAQAFETEFHNEELGNFIAHLRSIPGNVLPDHQKWLKEKLFGEE